ncbi:hypothetical protein [Psychroserpens ponticola]|uniref:Lysoplasmalogenase n=1 Tax=Psychroserpens ponticola TaxID=2932268 RepID=A0ABY7RTT7_9FLAO|nr:hypothetical protein [Psychroserpens ponticola]WCO00521.1 hypothetical protein MUN68_010620 [Psychroserpens ponticola]
MVLVLVVIVLCSAVATYFNSIMVPKTVKLITVTILMTFYFCQLNTMANVFLTTFLIFFIGDAFAVFSFGEIMLKLSKSMYIGAYLLLIFILLGKLKKIKFDSLVSVYLILVLLLNSYFLYVLFEVAKENFVDEVNLVLYVFHGITLIALTYLSFAVYLSKETGQSITFLLMVFCFVFADVLDYINTLYIYYWLFEVFERTLHISGLFLLYKYVYDHHTMVNEDEKMKFSDYFVQTTQELRDIRVDGVLD